MKQINLTIPVDSEKLSALRQYAAKKEVRIENELQEAVEKLYEKHVPAAVREYLAEREPPPPARVRPSRAKPNPAAEQVGGSGTSV